MAKGLTLEELVEQLEPMSIEFLVAYTLDDPEDNLGALSPFIIDVDVDTTTALIRAEFKLREDEKHLWQILEGSYYKDGAFAPDGDAYKSIISNFNKIFDLTIYAVNPKNQKKNK